MTVRTKSKSWQWTVWLCAALALLAVYVCLSRGLFNSVTWDLLDPRLHRLAIPLVAFFIYVAWNTRWDGVRREKKAKAKVKVEGQGQQRNLMSCAAEPLNGTQGLSALPVGQSVDATETSRTTKESDVHCTPTPNAYTSVSSASDDATGEELFDQARALPHQIVPDFDNDTEYLDLLGKSASKGYSPALTKLGEYAMRRAAWVEAYYWMKLAQRNGMHGLSPTLREIRRNWSLADFPNQSSNVNSLFTVEAGSLGRALLHVDSGHEAAKAKEFLKANHPEFVT